MLCVLCARYQGCAGNPATESAGCLSAINAAVSQSAGRHAIPVPAWLRESGPHSAVVVSSRCRGARNLAGVPFPWRAKELQRRESARSIADALQRGASELDHAAIIHGHDLDSSDNDRLIEWRYASPDWIEGGSNRCIAVGATGALSILVHEEDHLRLQDILPGLQVESATRAIESALHTLARYLHFGWCSEFGFVTASLANAGTGMRASVLVHLAGLARTGGLDPVLQAASDLGCTVRGLYGEGSLGTGGLFQVSNRCSDVGDAGTITGKVASTARFMVEAETKARAELFGSELGKERLRLAASEAIETLFRVELPPRELLATVSVLRLAACEGILHADHFETAEWVSLSGQAAATDQSGQSSRIPFEAMRRSAELRKRLRAVAKVGGSL
jgi:protein arginine kinase